MELLFLIAIGFAARSAWDHVSATRKASAAPRLQAAAKAAGGNLPQRKARAVARRNSAGWWLREAGSGFPVARTGWHAGWIAHKTEALQHRARREEARTLHGDVQASVLEELPKHKQRQAEARARRDAILAQLDDAPPSGAKGRKAVEEAAGAVILPFVRRPRPAAPLPSDTVGEPEGQPEPGPVAGPRLSDHVESGDPLCGSCRGTGAGEDGNGTCPECRGWGHGPGNPDAPKLPADAICQACGNPGRPGDPVVQDGNHRLHRSHITDDIARRAERLNGGSPSADTARDPTDPTTEGEHVTTDTDEYALKPGGSLWDPIENNGQQSGTPTPTGGAPMATATAETTYDQQLAAANDVISSAEQALAELKRQRLAQKVENLASLGLDSGSLSRAADIDDSLKEQEKLAQRTIDAATSFRDGLRRDHGNVNEAHQNSPNGGAERAFYQG